MRTRRRPARRREADLVEAVVDAEREAVEAEDLLREPRRERQRVVAVGDRAAERRLPRALGIDVDPLVVAGHVGERVDASCVTSCQSEVPSVLALGPFELLESGDRAHGRGPYPARPMPRPLLLADAPHLLYRAFFALPDSITDADGARSTRCSARSTSCCWCVERYEPRAVVMCFGAGGGRVPHRALPALPRRPAADARRARAAVGARARALRGARLARRRARRPRGGRPARLLRARRGGGRRRRR